MEEPVVRVADSAFAVTTLPGVSDEAMSQGARPASSPCPKNPSRRRGARERSERGGPTEKPLSNAYGADHLGWPGARYGRAEGVIKTLFQVPSLTFEELRSTSNPLVSA